MVISNGAIESNRIVFSQKILRTLGAILIVCGLLGAVNAKEKDGWWQNSSKTKQGAFIGAEFGLGETYIGLLSSAVAGSGFSPNINLIGGYHWYFMDEPYFHLGLRLKGHFGYSYHGADLYAYGLSNNGSSISADVHSIQGGIEPSFIWDFLDYKKHTLGAFFSPLGFEIGGYFGSLSANQNMGALPNNSIELTSYVKFIYMLNWGVHYYYNAKHFVFVGHRYRKVFGGYSANKVQGGKTSYGFIALPSHSFVISYGYKF